MDRLVPTKWLHGCCVGCDEDSVYQIHLWHCAKPDKVCVVGCPGYFVAKPWDTSMLSSVALNASDEVRVARGMFARNRMMCHEAEALVACPFQAEHQESGGTWFTIDHMKTLGKPVFVIEPMGEVREE
jgi:hypothetical protein